MTDQDIIMKALQEAMKCVQVSQAARENSQVRADSGAEQRQAERVKSKLEYDDGYYEKKAEEYIEFTYKNPTIFHVVEYFSSQLNDAGFKFLSEKRSWGKLPAGKYYTTRNGTALVAFVVGEDWTPEKGAGIIGGHIDALTTLLKPRSKKDKVEGYELLGVAPYAGAMSDVWWDRDLGIGGRLIVKDPSTGKVVQKLVDSTPHPIGRIPTLAPHFGAPANGPFNKETQTVPVIGYSSADPEVATEEEKSAPLYGKHSLKLLRYIASLAGVKVSDIIEWELQLFDVQKGTRGGLGKEFIFSPRVDDRICSYTAIDSLIEAEKNSLLNPDDLSVVVLVDNEEIGSESRQGIRGGILELALSRLISSLNPSEDSSSLLRVAFANSIILSADVNHLFNPNFPEVYLEHNRPVPNVGLAIAIDPNIHFATDSVGVALLEQVAALNDDKLQYIQGRNDSRTGSSIGPYVSTQTGARTIDIGIAQLSMHSIRAAVGYKDVGLATKYFNGFFANWSKIYEKYGEL